MIAIDRELALNKRSWLKNTSCVDVESNMPPGPVVTRTHGRLISTAYINSPDIKTKFNIQVQYSPNIATGNCKYWEKIFFLF